MPLKSKNPARPPLKTPQPMTLKSKKVARPITQTPHPDSDPVGFAGVLAQTSMQLEEAYHTQLRAFLRKFALVRFAPAVRRSISAAVTAEGGPVSFEVTLTFYPPDASGFARVDGALITPVAELAAEAEPAKPVDDPAYVDVQGLFGQTVRMHRPAGGWRKRGRRR